MRKSTPQVQSRAQEALEDALDSAFRNSLATPGYVARRLAALGSRGTGVPVLQELLAERTDGRPADSRRRTTWPGP